MHTFWEQRTLTTLNMDARSPLPLLVIIISLAVVGISHAATTTIRCHDSERDALLEFKQRLRDPAKRLSSWVVDEDCCTWEGIRCSNVTNRVMQLNLRNRQRLYLWDDCTDDELHYKSDDGFGCKWALHGDISPSLLSLQHLSRLDLSGNFFRHEPIPDFLGSLRKLTYLNLSSAGFKGKVPPQLGNLSCLHHLDLSYNYYINDDDQFSYGMYLEDAGWISHLTSLRHLNMKRVSFRRAFNWLQALNALPSIEEVLLADCHLVNFPHSLPHVNFTSLTTLNLAYNKINLSVPDWLFNMTSLEYLYLGGNELNWRSSASIAKLTSLKDLDLFENIFLNNFKTAAAVSNLCKLQILTLIGVSISDALTNLELAFSGCLKFSLEELNLMDTKLSGPLPDWLGTNMKNLKFLGLSFNSLYGSLPASLGSLSSLQGLDLRHNNFNGIIAKEIGQMKGLVYLNLGYNSLKLLAVIHLANLTSLKHLDISNNTLVLNDNYWIPPFQLDILHMAFTQIEPRPHFPNWLRTQRTLYDLDLTAARIQDMVPYWLPSGLKYLHLANNYITGNMPQHLQNLTFLDLSNNLLSGQLPSTITNMMPSIYWLDLSMNNLNGSIPSSFCQIKFWAMLRLSNNRLSGELPNCWKNSSRLVVLNLSRNKLQGRIPKSICNLRRLQSLHLSYNSLSGQVPDCLKNSTRMVTLDLAYNHFTGEVSTWLGDNLLYLRTLNLRSNAFTGNIPETSHLEYLQILDLSNNNLLGSIPRSIGNFSAMKSSISRKYFFNYGGQENIWIFVKGNELEYNNLLSYVRVIDLSNNDLSGSIPEEFGNLHALQSLNLSGNCLTGEIPQYIYGLHYLEVLDLSRNNLSGTIPASLGGLNFLSHLNLSYNNLSGPILTSYQLQTLTDPSIYVGNPNLCGPPISKNCTDDILTHSNQGMQNEDGDNKIEIIWVYLSIALGFIIGFWVSVGTLVLQRRWRGAFFQAIDNMYDTAYVMILVTVAKFKRGAW